jgi:hypothetical protein
VGYQVTSDARTGARAAKRYRGSARRLKRIRMRGNFSSEIWLLAGWVAFLLFVLLPWMARRMP